MCKTCFKLCHPYFVSGGTGLFGGANKPIGTASLFGGGSTTTGSKFGGFSGFGSTTKPLSAGTNFSQEYL